MEYYHVSQIMSDAVGIINISMNSEFNRDNVMVLLVLGMK